MPAGEETATPESLAEMADGLAGLLREQREKHPEAFDRALGRMSKTTGIPPQDITSMVSQRPDLAAMAAQLPKPDPRSPTILQAEAQRAAAKPYVEFQGARWYLSQVPDMFDLGELGEAINGIAEDPLQAMGVINRMLRTCLADYAGLRSAFREAKLGDDAASEAYAGLAMGLFEATAARPTEPPGGSSPGPPSTSTSSRETSPAAAPSASTGGHDWEALTRG